MKKLHSFFNSIKLTILTVLIVHFPIVTSVLNITSKDQYNQEVLNNKNKVLVEFAADWCSVCQSVKDPMEQISSEQEFNHIKFTRVNVDELNSVSQQNGIVGVPSFLYVDNGQKVDQEIGVQDMANFKNTLRTNLRKTFKLAQNDITPTQPSELEQVTIEIQPTTQPVTQAVEKATQKVADEIDETTQQIKEDIEQASDKITTDIKETAQETKEESQDIADTIWQWITDVSTQIKEWFEMIIDTIKSWF